MFSLSPERDTISIYLREIGQFPLLTPDQEITGARAVQKMIALLERKQELRGCAVGIGQPSNPDLLHQRVIPIHG